MRRLRVAHSMTLTMIIAMCVLIPPALAQDFGFGVRPTNTEKGYFQFDVQPGQLIEDSVTVLNPSDTGQIVKLMAVSGLSSETGELVLSFDKLEGAASWITLESDEILDNQVKIPAQSQVEIPFSIQIPVNIESGEYVAGFLSSPVDLSGYNQNVTTSGAGDEPQRNTFAVQVVPEVGVLVVLNVGVTGDQKCQVAIDALKRSIEYGKWNLGLQLQNSGNVHFSGSGLLNVRPAAGGEPLISRYFEVRYFLADDTIHYPFIEQVPPAGEYIVEAAMISKDDPVCSATYQERVEISAAEEEEVIKQESQLGENTVAQSRWFESPVLVAGVFLLGLAALVLASAVAYRLVTKKNKEV